MAKKASKTTRTKKNSSITVDALRHDDASRKNIPTAEYESVMQGHEKQPVPVRYERGVAGLDDEKQARNRDLDPQLVWRGKDEQDWSELVGMPRRSTSRRRSTPKY